MKAQTLLSALLIFAFPAFLFATPPANDNFNDAIVLSATAGFYSCDTTDATAEPGEPQHLWDEDPQKSVWWKWIGTSNGFLRVNLENADFDTVLAAYSGLSLTTLTQIASADWYKDEHLGIDVYTGKTYYIAVDGYNEFNYGSVTFNWRYFNFDAPPKNDSFSDATTISGNNGMTVSTTLFATVESGEPDFPYHSVWWNYTAEKNGLMMFNNYGSTFETTIGVYTGKIVSILERIVYSDTGHAITFNAVSGITYRVAVGGYDDAGIAKLNWQQFFGSPTNDNFSNATPLNADAGSVTNWNYLATSETSEPPHASNGPSHSIWCQWSNSYNIPILSVDTFGSDFDTLLAVYTGSAVSSLVEIAANDEAFAFGDLYSRVYLDNLIDDVNYYFVVDGFDGEAGRIVLNWEAVPETGIVFSFLCSVFSILFFIRKIKCNRNL